MDDIIIVGSSGHATSVIDVVRKEGRFRIAGLLDRSRTIGEETLGCRVLGQDEDLPALASRHAIKGLLVAIGDNAVRGEVTSRIHALSPGLPLVTAIHPRATIGEGALIGVGSVVMAGAVIGANARVGRGCILNTNASLDHDAVMEDHASLGPGSVVGGRCHIGEYSAVCIGAVLSHGIRIGRHAIIGAGAVVMKPVADGVVAYGSPAKVIRSRKPGDRYL